MTTSKSPAPLSSVYGNEEELKAIEKYREMQQQLENALTKRNQLFDPVLLAMAQGFLSPTKTGSFGEALGNVSAAIAPAAQKQKEEDMSIAKMRFELAQAGLEQERSTQSRKLLENMISSKPEGDVESNNFTGLSDAQLSRLIATGDERLAKFAKFELDRRKSKTEEFTSQYGSGPSEMFVQELGGTIKIVPIERQHYERMRKHSIANGWYDDFKPPLS